MFHLKFDRTMDSQKKYSNNHGRKPKTDKMRHRYVFRLDDGDNARFLALFDESGKATRAEFIVSALFGREIKVVKLDKGTQDFYMRLTSFHSQFRSIGVNYNQCVRALKSNFSEKKALAFLYKLEQHTLELVELSKQISALADDTVAEANIESLIRAKGYEDAVVMLGDGSANIVVAPPDGGLQAEDVAVIRDIVISETGMTAGQIKIVEAS